MYNNLKPRTLLLNYNIQNLFVWPFIGSAPQHQVQTFEKKFSRKVTSGQITEVRCYVPDTFTWEKL
jgi:hypothetical protein